MSFPTSVPVELLTNPRKLYDFFMAHLEPELLTENLPHLDEPYAGETAEERAERYAYYIKACTTLQAIIVALNTDLKERAAAIIRAVDSAAHAADSHERDAALASISHAIASA